MKTYILPKVKAGEGMWEKSKGTVDPPRGKMESTRSSLCNIIVYVETFDIET